VSLSDLAVEELKDKRLKVRVSRESYDSNRFNVTFIVPQNIKEALKTDVALKDAGPREARVPISVSFDPKNE